MLWTFIHATSCKASWSLLTACYRDKLSEIQRPLTVQTHPQKMLSQMNVRACTYNDWKRKARLLFLCSLESLNLALEGRQTFVELCPSPSLSQLQYLSELRISSHWHAGLSIYLGQSPPLKLAWALSAILRRDLHSGSPPFPCKTSIMRSTHRTRLIIHNLLILAWDSFQARRALSWQSITGQRVYQASATFQF